jgi:hypothetical protein
MKILRSDNKETNFTGVLRLRSHALDARARFAQDDTVK